MAWCAVDKCTRETYRRQPYCTMHYQRVRSHGDPLITKRKYRMGVGATQIERFWSLVNKDVANGCWEWTGHRYVTGYGMYRFEGKARRAHRISMYLATGQWAQEYLLHSCDNRLCVNPDHLREGTAKDNSADAIMRNRTPKGERHGNSKLTTAQVLAIREAHKNGESQHRIASTYNVDQSHISDIVNYKRWRHI